MRKLIPCFLTLLISMHAIGLGLIYLVDMQCCEMEFENKAIEENEIQTEFIVGVTDFLLLNTHEIQCKGKLFDIRKKEIRNGRTVYFAVNDEKEERCVAGIARLAKGNSSQNSLHG